MADALATYLADHLAGSMHAVELLKNLREAHGGERLGQFAAGLLVEIEADRDALKGLAERVGSGSSGLKELTAWLGEKISRLKLRHGEDGLGTFEALEFLELGIHGKWALWRALGAVASTDGRLQGLDYDHLAARAQKQESRVEEQRMELAGEALHPAAA
jgi:hypothetical protein